MTEEPTMRGHIRGGKSEFKGPRRVWTMKEEQSMLSRSGFGWVDNTNMVVVKDDVWDNYVKGAEDFVEATQLFGNVLACKSPEYYVPHTDDHLNNMFGEDVNYYNTAPSAGACIGADSSTTKPARSRKRKESSLKLTNGS
ncbi:hypothetical protein Salat_0607600 [Sesamum alatum]|uniref:Myb/SANT-like domain-containing protein n=1 Tax=Sesamum alatum TaxID=300844 RepID=A0AAE2CU10_9LAMI|nr:hypothetical protein Salat_0607600 [Sesamum alatum]